jgi:urea transport system permease protein
VDLNSIGTNGNAHQGAALLGMLSLAASAAPPILLTLLAVVGILMLRPQGLFALKVRK